MGSHVKSTCRINHFSRVLKFCVLNSLYKEQVMHLQTLRVQMER